MKRLLLTGFFCVVASAQQSPTRALAPANAALDEEFSRLRAGRELPDGRLLVTDIVDHRLAVVDWSRMRVNTISRIGDGPDEYRSPELLIPLALDSTLLVDPTTDRWFVLAGSRIVAVARSRSVLNVQLGNAVVGADRGGHVLGQPVSRELDVRRLREMRTRESSNTADSLSLVLGDRRSGKVDTIATLRSASLRRTMAFPKNGGTAVTYILTNPLDVSEKSLLFADGWIAIARVKPFRVDWRKPDGGWLRGAPIGEAIVRVDDAVKRQAIARKFPGMRDLPFEPSAYPPWPTIMPPFTDEAPTLYPLEDGRLVVRRSPGGDRTNRYDVIDRMGKIAFSLVLRQNQSILTFGVRSVYVVETDDDDVQRLARYAWP